jgi:hypothetical protein
VLWTAAVIFSGKLERFVSTRRVEAAWKETRALGLDRAQPLELPYEDAREIEGYLYTRLERQRSDGETETFGRLFDN